MQQKNKEEIIGDNLSHQIRYSLDYKNKLLFNFLAEKDIGELYVNKRSKYLLDFMSSSFSINNISLSKVFNSNIIVGDYVANFGQGLVVWKGSSFNGFDSGGFYKRSNKIKRYTSSNESNFFRGIALSINKKPNFHSTVNELNLNLFFSRKGVDALIKDNSYTSIYNTGIHNTSKLLEASNSMNEIVFGANAMVSIGRFNVSGNWINYYYNNQNGRTIREYNKYQQYYGNWGNISIDFNFQIGRAHV